ncbi:hypothetical protein ACFLIM_36140 [Nonomuraea sp. M3C6]|uniref:Uncharacterized protein n=1 Tax=Nonomuraea marmarensis TaxID=3351344 RepID=A0ABW7AQU8_9ACTN
MGGKKTKETRQRLEELRATQQRQDRRRKLLITSIGSVIAVAALAALGYGIVQDREAESKPSGDGGNPPWALPANPMPGIKAAGLSTGPMGTADHYHAHLDIFVDSKPVPVAANIGIEQSGAMSALHTHDDRGVIHVEAQTKGDTYTLGQVFKQWGVALSVDQLGALKTGAGKTLTAQVNGKQVGGNPADIVIKAHQQIALVYGKPDPAFRPPATYQFQEGE